MKRKLSWRPDIPDIRDYPFAKLSIPIAKLPSAINLRRWCSEVEDQQYIGSCFVGGTKIPLLNGTEETIKNLSEKTKGVWVYGCDINGNIVPARATAFKTRKKQSIILITLDNGKEIKCTPSHQFLLRDGSYKQASKLTIDDSLMPLYRKNEIMYKKYDYEMYFNPRNNKWYYTHRSVIWNTIGKYKGCIHHKDFNRFNNSPDNLEVMDMKEHMLLHSKLSNKFKNWNGTEKQRKHSRKNILIQYKNNPDWNKGASSKGGNNNWEKNKNNKDYLKKVNFALNKGRTDESIRNSAIESIRKTMSTVEYKKKRKDIAKNMWNNLSSKSIQNIKKSAQKNLGTSGLKNQIAKMAHEVINIHGGISEENWKNTKFKKNFSYSTALKYFNSDVNLESVGNHFNHKIKSITILSHLEDVYCLEVPKTKNFALSAGVFVHNCTANAIVGMLEFNCCYQKLPYKNFSRLFLYYNERVLIDSVNEDSGAYLRDGVKTLALNGICESREWPYDLRKWKTQPPKDCYKNSIDNRASSYYRLETLDEMKTALANGHPFVFGFAVYSSFMSAQVANAGIVPIPATTEQMLGGHAVMAIGYDDATQRFLIRNSWGKGWGIKEGNLQGYCTMPYEYLSNRNLSDDFWTITK